MSRIIIYRIKHGKETGEEGYIDPKRNIITTKKVENETNKQKADKLHQFTFSTDLVGNMEEFIKYVEKAGYHFTPKLAEWASKQMVNDNGDQTHKWSVSDVQNAFHSMGYKLPKENTWGDATYLANMHYSDFFGESLHTEEEVLKQAYVDLRDKDGYPEKPFNRWVSDLIGKRIMVQWEKMI